MRVLILSCNTGEGHNSCAKAIKEVYDSHGDLCVIEDSLEFISVKFSKFMSWGHTTMYCHIPWLFKSGYSFSEKHPGIFNEKSGVYKLLTSGYEKLHTYITEERYDTVICVHVFSALLLTEMLKKFHMDIKTCFIATDYTCSPSVQDSNLDRYFIPEDDLANEFEFPNIPREKIVGSGIPVRQMFYKSTEKAQAKSIFSIPQNHKHLLIMCGSMGCGPIKKLARLLSKTLNRDCDMSIVCGLNKKLKQKLERKYRGCENVHVHGFIKDMSTIMDSADLYLTKPGGLSVSEAKIKNLPMVYIDAVAGCEEYNRRYFENLGGAKTCGSVKDIAAVCKQLLENDFEQGRMVNILKEQHSLNSAQYIYTTMKDLKKR